MASHLFSFLRSKRSSVGKQAVTSTSTATATLLTYRWVSPLWFLIFDFLFVPWRVTFLAFDFDRICLFVALLLLVVLLRQELFSFSVSVVLRAMATAILSSAAVVGEGQQSVCCRSRCAVAACASSAARSPCP